MPPVNGSGVAAGRKAQRPVFPQAVDNSCPDKSVLGCRYGSSRPQRDIARYAEPYRRDRLLLDELVTRTCPVDAFGQARAEAEAGRVARAVLTF